MTTAADQSDPRIELDLVRALYAQTVRSIIPGIVGGLVMVAALWPTASGAALLVWYAVILANCVARYALNLRFQQTEVDASRAKIWARRFAASTFVNGLTFGCLALFFYTPGDPLRQMLIMLMIGAACTAGAAVAYYPPAMAAFMSGLLGPALIRFVVVDGFANVFVTLGVLFLSAVVMNFGFGHAQMLRELIETRRRNLDLIDALEQKSELAQAAQARAEVASLAKSRFFAAASHDLRQPLQALGLYAASLRETRREPEDARKIDQILSSVDALESLFDELLDISKLDAGYVEPVRSHFPVAMLFERLEATYAPLARKSGLLLELRPNGTVLYTDPVLLERILANLVANGLRYTEAGGVAVACAVRDGKALITIEDTGIGIPAAEHKRVFDEFYQLENPERDRRKGLGLGLSTVRRIAQLLGHVLTLESEVGRGTRFTLEVPPGDPARVSDRAAPPFAVDLDALAGRRVLVIEDEASVRAGLVQLLRDWRCSVVAAPSAAEAIAVLEGAPEAIVADYRLRKGENGIGAIRDVRAHFALKLPAILVTGDSAPEIFLAARDHELPLLTKPVRAARLRAALSHLLAQKREPERDAA